MIPNLTFLSWQAHCVLEIYDVIYIKMKFFFFFTSVIIIYFLIWSTNSSLQTPQTLHTFKAFWNNV